MLIAHDLGTTGNKASLHEDDGRLRAAVTVGYPARFADGGVAEQDPRDWERAVVEATRTLLAQHPVVFLTVSAESVARRIAGAGRPLLSGEADPVERWRTIFAERRSWYEEVADLTVDTSHRPMRMLAEEIAAWRKEQS